MRILTRFYDIAHVTFDSTFKDVISGTVYPGGSSEQSPGGGGNLELIPLDTVSAPAFNGHAVLLTGSIGLQFFLELPVGKTASDYPDSYVTFEGNKVDSGTRHPLPEATAVINGTDTGRYEFIVSLSSIQMADKFTPAFHKRSECGCCRKQYGWFYESYYRQKKTC